MIRRFILTGPPGAGKTTMIRALAGRGHAVVEEAATDVIAREQAAGVDASWDRVGFIEAVAELQRLREAEPMRAALRFSDRSLFCTLALADYLGRTVSRQLVAEAEELAASGWFERRIIFVEPLSFIVATAARRISLEEARRFGAIHEDVYRRFGFDLEHVAPGDIDARLQDVLEIVRA